MFDAAEFLANQDLSTIENINEACQKLLAHENEVDKTLEAIISRKCSIEEKINGIGRPLTELNVLNGDSKKLASMIDHTSVLAENVSDKVRRLDEARSRVSECQRRVHDLIDLQLCSQGVTRAITEEDFEKGAAHINRFLSMDQNLLQRTANDISESVTSVSAAVETLKEATSTMRELVSQKFDEAVKKDDLATVERFFKILPMLGMYDEGIDRFVRYICTKLDVRAKKELRTIMDVAKAEKRTTVAFADTMTQLLENIARVIEVNQPIIEMYYSNGKLCRFFVILQKECDAEVSNLLNEFRKNRQIPRKISQINDFMKAADKSAMGHYRKPSGGSIDKLNPKDIDALLGEITVIHSRAELYIKFMRRRIVSDLDKSQMEDSEKKKILAQFESTIVKSDLSRKMQELLGTYLLFERYFMEESVLKAISMDTLEPEMQCSSVVDDVFFIIRKSIRRSISTQSLDGICAVINNAASCLDTDYLPALRSPLKAGYSSGYIDLAQAYNVFQTSIQQGKIQTSDSEHARANFIAQLNNADMSTEFIQTLWTTMSDEIQGALPGLTTREKEILDSCLSGLKSVHDSLKALVDFGIQQLRSSAIKPRLHPWVDTYLNYNHQLSEDELAVYEAGETFIQYLILQIDGLMNVFKTGLSARNYDALVSILATDVTARLERAIKKSAYNRLGGLILDQEVRALGTYLTSATSWSVRDKLARLNQIATLLNLEKLSEISEYWNPADQSDTPTWRLTPSDMRTILALRIDFRMDEIKRLRF